MGLSRRRLLALAGLGMGAAAGCSGDSGTASSGQPPGTTAGRPGAPSATDAASTTEPTPGGRGAIHVASDGDDGNDGSEASPLASVQTALDRARPGDTVTLAAGEYRETINTKRAGNPGEPITITGPADAVVRPPVDGVDDRLFDVLHSHVHLTGVTFDGLADPDSPDDPAQYAEQIVAAQPPTWHDTFPDYLTDVRIEPHAVGNARGKLVNAWRVNDLQVGGFEVTGPAGVAYSLGGKSGYELGAVVSLGRSPNNFGTEWYPWEGPDRSHDVRVHHVANTGGHDHTELVKTHGGMYDVTIEYCTDAGGSGRDDGGGAGFTIPSAKTTVRWCIARGGDDHGVSIMTPGSIAEEAVYSVYEPLPDEQFPGRNNAVYGNRLLDNAGDALNFYGPERFPNGPEHQRVVCGNEVRGSTQGEPAATCPASVPSGDGVGHTGGDGARG